MVKLQACFLFMTWDIFMSCGHSANHAPEHTHPRSHECLGAPKHCVQAVVSYSWPTWDHSLHRRIGLLGLHRAALYHLHENNRKIISPQRQGPGAGPGFQRSGFSGCCQSNPRASTVQRGRPSAHGQP